MSKTYISAALRRFVTERAQNRCEYCLIGADDVFLSHEIDHVIAEKHDGITESSNLALACFYCNTFKGSDLGSFDPLTREFSFLFHPRTQKWSDHFAIEQNNLIGTTPTGRTTIKLLRIAERELTEGQLVVFRSITEETTEL